MEKGDVTLDRVGGYRVVRRLATGGTSDVLLAKAEGPHGFERTVVLKLLLSQYQNDEELQRMFAREAAAYARLSHPSIVRLFDFFALHGQLVMVLEFVDGPPLSRLRGMLKAVGQPLDDKAAIYVAQRLFDALAAAHAATDDTGGPAPVIHRDVNPTNILIPWDGHVKLADFGVAKVTGATHQSSTGLIKGTFGYMAPEQVTGDTVTPRADVYAAAIVLWEMLTKRRAFQRGALPEIEVLRLMAEPKIVSLDVLRPDVDRNIREAVRRALEPKAERRRITAEEMVQILREIIPSEDGKEHLSKALMSVRHEPKPQYTVPPPAVSLSPQPTPRTPFGETLPVATQVSAASTSGGPAPRPIRKTMSYGALAGAAAAARPAGAGAMAPMSRPLPPAAPPPLPKAARPPVPVPTKVPTLAKAPAPPPPPPRASSPDTTGDDERPTQVPVTAAPIAISAGPASAEAQVSTERSVQLFDIRAEPAKVKESIDQILRDVPSSLPPRLSDEIRSTEDDHTATLPNPELKVPTRDLGKIPAAPPPMDLARLNETPSAPFEPVDRTVMMGARPVAVNPDHAVTVRPAPMTPATAMTTPQIPPPPLTPSAQATTAPMPRFTPPPEARPSPLAPRPAAPAAPPGGPMFPVNQASISGSYTPATASYSGAIATVPPEPMKAPKRRGAGGLVAALGLLLVAGAAGTAGYIQWHRSHLAATTPKPPVPVISGVSSVVVAPAPVPSGSGATSASAGAPVGSLPAIAVADPPASASAVAPGAASAVASGASAGVASAAVAPSSPASSASAGTSASGAPVSSADLPAGSGFLRTSSAAPGHRIYIDEKVVGQTPETITVKCGGHWLRLGSNGFRRPIEIPCGGELVIDK